MAELIHVSKVRIIKDKGPLRRAWSRSRRRRPRSTISSPPSAA